MGLGLKVKKGSESIRRQTDTVAFDLFMGLLRIIKLEYHQPCFVRGSRQGWIQQRRENKKQ